MSYDQILATFLEKSAQGIPLAIVGTTGVGKTDLSWKLATSERTDTCQSSVLLSVDSRQVYADIPILSGADVPENAHRETDEYEQLYFSYGKCRLYGVGMLKHTESWSLGQFAAYALPIIQRAVSAHQPVILVGGTGLYYQHLFSVDPAISVPPDEQLRNSLKHASVPTLQDQLAQYDSQKLESMNHSDRNNPRRLIRAIEIARSGSLSHHAASRKGVVSVQDMKEPVFIGLRLPDSALRERIVRRVHARFAGAKLEVSSLLDRSDLSEQLQSTLGFSQIAAYIRGECTERECLAHWIQAEWRYAKRQIAWWKKHQSVAWYDTRKLTLQ